MRSLTIFTIIGLLFVFNISLAETIPAADVLITGACPDGTTMPIDVFGDLLGTIPAGPPGSNNAYVGMTYANMEIIQNVNIYPNTVPSQFLRINPVNGVVNATINFPFNGYVMGITFDGTHLWVVQWSPSNTIHQIALDGTLINSYPSPTGSYSARTIAYDPGSTNFWIGANLSSGVTELWKVDNTMTPIASTNTGSVVGWYMGGDWNGSAPTGSNLIVVDNVDNSIKQLDISGTTVTLVDQFACPEAYGEGLTHDGADLWHSAAYASNGVFWRYDDGYGGGAANFTVTLTYNFGSPVPAGGGAINMDAFIQNNETFPVNFDLWVEIPPQITPPGVPNRNLTFPAGHIIDRDNMYWGIPGSWPPGDYEMIWLVGDLATQNAWASDSFPFSKSINDDGSGYALWEIEGDPLDQLFEGIDFGATVVSEFALLGSYPNPFNPSATISYTLDNSDLVKLSVYDLSGRQVATLVDGYRDAGAHEVNFDASGLASGVYVYRLSSGQQVASGKMVLMK